MRRLWTSLSIEALAAYGIVCVARFSFQSAIPAIPSAAAPTLHDIHERVDHPVARLCTGSERDSQGRWEITAEPTVPKDWPKHGWWNCAGSPLTSRSRFTRSSGCRLAGIRQVVQSLMRHRMRLFFVGDSLMRGLFETVKRLMQMNSDAPLPVFYPWKCPGPTDIELSCRFEVGGSDFLRSHAEAERDPRPAAGVLIINFGMHYNLLCTRANCSFKDPVPMLLDALRRGDEIALKTGLRSERQVSHHCPSRANFDKWSEAVCFSQQQRAVLRQHPDLPEVQYGKDLIRLVRFLQRNRKRLPEQIVWVDSSVQHFKLVGTFHTGFAFRGCSKAPRGGHNAWRNKVALRIMRAAEVSSSLTVVPMEELLLSRHEDHSFFMRNGTRQQECTHWCSGSSTWYEYVSWVLTVVLADGRSKRLPWAIAGK